MVRRIFVSLGLLGVLCSAAPMVARGVGDEILTLPSTASPDIAPSYPYLVGSDSNYLNAQVTFDGEGEASVALDIELYSVPDALTELTLVIPGESIRIRRALQQYEAVGEAEYCIDEGEYDATLRDYPCLEMSTYPTYETKVERIEPAVTERTDGVQVTLPLPHAIAVGDSTSIALSYKAQGYTTQSLGVWQFAYLTPQVPYDMDTVRVRVDVADELILKGGQSNVAYKDSLAESLATGALDAFGGGFATDFSNVVYDENAFIKQTTSLDPNETFEVSGTYGQSWWRLYWVNTALLAAAIVVLLGLVIWGERRAHALEGK